MARRRAVDSPTADDGLILPLRLLERDGLSAVQYREQLRERRQWLRERGINARDWDAVHSILKASWKAHGIPSSADRARLRLGVSDPREVLRPGYTYPPQTPSTEGLTR